MLNSYSSLTVRRWGQSSRLAGLSLSGLLASVRVFLSLRWFQGRVQCFIDIGSTGGYSIDLLDPPKPLGPWLRSGRSRPGVMADTRDPRIDLSGVKLDTPSDYSDFVGRVLVFVDLSVTPLEGDAAARVMNSVVRAIISKVD